MFGRTKHTEDPVFGKLVFVPHKNPDFSYWEGGGVFEPRGTEIEYFVYAGEAGPSDAQRQMYREFAANFDKLFDTLAPLLRGEYEAKIHLPCPPDAASVFHLEWLSIPKKESDEWELDFSCSIGGEWLLTVEMHGWEPTGRIESSR